MSSQLIIDIMTLRHGRTDYTEKGLDLTPGGEAHSREVAAKSVLPWLYSLQVRRGDLSIITSPAARAKGTGTVISQVVGNDRGIVVYDILKPMTWLGIRESTFDRAQKSHVGPGGKVTPGYAWDYEVDTLGYKAYMIDLMAAICLEQMKKLDQAHGVEFDRLFLNGMIGHHRGAIKMVADLINMPPSGQESEIFRFITDVDADQRAEIDVMQQMLYNLPGSTAK